MRRHFEPTTARLGGRETDAALRAQGDAAAQELAALVATVARRIPRVALHADEAHGLDLGLRVPLGRLLLQLEYAALGLGTRRAELEVRGLTDHHATRLFAVAEPPPLDVAVNPDPFGVVPHRALAWIQKRALSLARSVDMDLHDSVRAVLLDAVGGKLTPDESTAAIRRVTQSAESRARLIAVTETTAAFNQGRLAMFADAGVDYLLFTAVLDERTSDICESRDGLLLAADDPLVPENTPPLHGNCRSLWSPVIGKLEPALVDDAEAQDWGGVTPLPSGWSAGAFAVPGED
jgi:SPP1 gp7 family putative phage head morphogenesis protein